MGRHSNYADQSAADEDLVGAFPEHRLVLGDFRGFTPTEHEDGDGEYGGLAVGASGDWSWKPACSSKDTPTYNARAYPLAASTHYRQAPQGAPRATTRFTRDGRIAQTYIPTEKQARQLRTGDAPRTLASTMSRVWSWINDKAAA